MIFKKLIFIICCLFTNIGNAQNQLSGSLQNEKGENITFATCAVYSTKDSSLLKIETSDINGQFKILDIFEDTCYLKINALGFNDLVLNEIYFKEMNRIDLGVQILTTQVNLLEAAVVTSSRALIETKADRIIFNIDGTVNSTGNNASQLLKKAPGVSMGNNGAIKVLGRTGILLYIDGKNSGLIGDEASQYLENLPADQIDRIEIIHNPGVKYDAQGMAGIIDVRLKKNDSHGFNASLSVSLSQGKRGQATGAFNVNYKNKRFNVFGMLGYGKARRWSDLLLTSTQNNFSLEEFLDYDIRLGRYNYRYGLDYFIHPNHTIGILGSRVVRNSDVLIDGSNHIGKAETIAIDSILVSKNISQRFGTFDQANINYQFDNKKQSLNLDLDYGDYFKESTTDQPNSYFGPDREILLRQSDNFYTSEINIQIYSMTCDYEQGFLDGQLGLGVKWSKVQTQNEFLFYNKRNSDLFQNNNRSNLFDYEEEVYAAYFSYQKKINDKFDFSIGSRLEQTYSTGDLTVFESIETVEPIQRDYLNFFPNLSFNYQLNPKQHLTLSYGKRINRPNYRRLNPFKAQVNELGFDKGNPFLKPEIADNFELGYSLNNSYHFKLAFSNVKNKIVGLIGPDDESPLAGFLGYDNLAAQEVINFSINAPFSITEKWRVQNNLSVSYTDNSADYGQGITITTNAFNFSINQTHSLDLNKQLKGEISAWYNGSDIWDGILYTSPNYSISAGLKGSFFDNKLSISLNLSDIFYTERFKGVSDFNGRLASTLSFTDTRRIGLMLKYMIGNRKVKSRRRITGMESEQKRTR